MPNLSFQSCWLIAEKSFAVVLEYWEAPEQFPTAIATWVISPKACISAQPMAEPPLDGPKNAPSNESNPVVASMLLMSHLVRNCHFGQVFRADTRSFVLLI